MASRGVRDGDVVAIHMPNSPEYIIAFQAVAQLGAINTTSNPLYTPSELTHQLRDSGAKYIITVPGLLENVKKVRRSAACQSHATLLEISPVTKICDVLCIFYRLLLTQIFLIYGSLEKIGTYFSRLTF